MRLHMSDYYCMHNDDHLFVPILRNNPELSVSARCQAECPAWAMGSFGLD